MLLRYMKVRVRSGRMDVHPVCCASRPAGVAKGLARLGV